MDNRKTWDALSGIAGLVAGWWLLAEFSAFLNMTLQKWGDLREVLRPNVLHLPRGVLVVISSVMLTVGLFALERAIPR